MAISKGVKAEMVKTIVAHGFNAKIKAANDAVRAVGGEVYKDVYSGGILRTMMALPDDYMDREWNMVVNWGGQLHTIRLPKAMPMPVCHNINRRFQSNAVAKVYESDNELMIAYDKACDNLRKIEREMENAERQAKVVIDSCSSFSKLWKVWPESFEVLKKFDVPSDTVYLPAVQLPNLNAALGLPPSTSGSADNGTHADA